MECQKAKMLIFWAVLPNQYSSFWKNLHTGGLWRAILIDMGLQSHLSLKMATKRLFPVEISLPLLQKCAGSFFFVVRCAGNGEQGSLQKEPFGKRRLHAVIDGFQTILDRKGSVLDDRLRDSFGA